MRPLFQWRLAQRALELGKRTLIMGIVNVTPDSFSDGGKYLERDKAVEHAEKLIAEGADIVDVGGESTRPGAHVTGSEPGHETSSGKTVQSVVDVDQELRRVIPVISELKNKRPGIVISVDTHKADVARAAVQAGAEIVNDVSGSWRAAHDGSLLFLFPRPSSISRPGRFPCVTALRDPMKPLPRRARPARTPSEIRFASFSIMTPTS